MEVVEWQSKTFAKVPFCYCASIGDNSDSAMCSRQRFYIVDGHIGRHSQACR